MFKLPRLLTMLLVAIFSMYVLIDFAFASSVGIRSAPITLPISAKINAKGDAKTLVERDRARVRIPHGHGQAKAAGVLDDPPDDIAAPLTDSLLLYTADVGIGDGTCTLLVDTGSSITWIKSELYIPGDGSLDLNEKVSQSYAKTRRFSGKLYADSFTFGKDAFSQAFGVADTTVGFEGLGIDGIVGLGPDDLTEGATSGGGTILTVTENLFKQGLIPSNLFGISFAPSNSSSDVINGEIDFGAVDISKIIGDIEYMPITSISPSSSYWGLDLSVTYGSNTTILGGSYLSNGFVDSGAVFVYLATEAFQTFQQATGATQDPKNGFLMVSSEQSLHSLFFDIGSRTFELTPNALVWPRRFNYALGGKKNATYLAVADLKVPVGQGHDFKIGLTFLRRFYSVFDVGHSRIGFAVTPFTNYTA